MTRDDEQSSSISERARRSSPRAAFIKNGLLIAILGALVAVFVFALAMLAAWPDAIL